MHVHTVTSVNNMNVCNEIYPGASEEIMLSVAAGGYIVATNKKGDVIIDIAFEHLLIKHWARDATKCNVIMQTSNPVEGFFAHLYRVQQLILRYDNNHDERMTYYTLEIMSYV